ncbi:CubicO group peptidase (beta-lactamase class C family) [Homoserinimonas aerilata]|uniref:CubicO group peptidase (Beta-lactamase class C family) n=1 Tax=Homoserinimonas aerilata TaxID=1162970 RepID=A0A542Y1Q0_9MICO|nr:serine hydrolase domain-containing protein [Homoserinimonas aerilata]TQL41999.1 CubicO group peptidase (beta-lactamase class C family) [Homoserinimonas aerilata]
MGIPSETVSAEALETVDGVFRDQQAGGAAPSAVWGVFDRSGLVHTGAAGRLEGGAIPDADTAYRIASCTKSFAAATVLALRDEGLLGLDDPVTRFVPELAGVTLPSADSPVPTVRMLLTMSAGFPTDDPWADRQEAMSGEEFAALLRAGVSFDSVPGTRFAYSNLGYALVGQVVEAVTGRGFREVVRERFLGPLGLTGTAFEREHFEEHRVAAGARVIDGRWEYLPMTGPGVFSPIGGLFSTVTDLARWAGWLASAFDADGADEPGSPLSRASRRELQQPHRLIPPDMPHNVGHPAGYGFGLFVDHYAKFGPVVSHSGGYPGFSAHMRWSAARGVGVVAFENATFSRVPVTTTAAFDGLLGSLPEPKELAVWPEVRDAQRAVTALLRSWNDADAQRLFTPNVGLDMPFAQRRAALAAAIDKVGGLVDGETTDASSAAPSQLSWFVPGTVGRLRVHIQLTPELPPRVQSLRVEALAPAAAPALG